MCDGVNIMGFSWCYLKRRDLSVHTGSPVVLLFGTKKQGGVNVADATVTKRKLAESLKSLMTERVFEKITITEICDLCNMNRNSFYYHFKDKYDLVNWIFDDEFTNDAMIRSYQTAWAFTCDLCDYLYENRMFYRKAFLITGQNSFSEHFINSIMPVFVSRLTYLSPTGEVKEIQLEIFSDFFLATIQRWITKKDCVAPEVFLDSLKELGESTSLKLYNKKIESEE